MNTIVIGGGLAGLTAANHLADGGHAVTVLEARAHLGGRAHSDTQEGFQLNQGPHALYQGGPGMRELTALGIDPRGWNPVAPARSGFYREGAFHRTPGGPRAAAQFTAWLATAARGKAENLDGLTVTDWIERDLSHPDARFAAKAFVRVTTFIADHDNFAATAAAQQLSIGIRPGVHYLGGWSGLVDSLAKRARERGARIETGASVRAISREDRWIVATDDEEKPADALIVAAGTPALARKLLGEHAPEDLPESPRIAEVGSLDLGLERLPKPLRRFALGTDQPFYASVHTPPRDEHVLLSLAAYLVMEDRTSGTRESLEQLADAVQPGWRDHLITSRHLPRMTANPLIPREGLHARPKGEVAPGLHLAGDWVGPEGLLSDAAFASGAAAARSILGAPVAVAA